MLIRSSKDYSRCITQKLILFRVDLDSGDRYLQYVPLETMTLACGCLISRFPKEKLLCRCTPFNAVCAGIVNFGNRSLSLKEREREREECRILSCAGVEGDRSRYAANISV